MKRKISPAMQKKIKVYRNTNLFFNSVSKFREIFSSELYEYFDNVTGFDAIGFAEDFLGYKEGLSIQNLVNRYYGKEAEKLIQTLIDGIPSYENKETD